jgi:hypothetical protein
MEKKKMATPPLKAEEDAQTQATATIGRPIYPVQEEELMGPILRRKKVVSMPLGAGGTIPYGIYISYNKYCASHHIIM